MVHFANILIISSRIEVTHILEVRKLMNYEQDYRDYWKRLTTDIIRKAKDYKGL